MATKTKLSKKKAAKKDQNSFNHSNGKILGADAKAIGTAIAAAVVGEIAQAAINRTSRAISESGRVSQVQDAVRESTSSTKANLENTDLSLKGAAQGVASVVREVLQEIKPAITEAVTAAIASANTVNRTVEQGVDTVKTTAENITEDAANGLGDTVKNSADTTKQSLQTVAGNTMGIVKSALEEFKPTEKNKKGKKKSSKQKGNKKNKK